MCVSANDVWKLSTNRRGRRPCFLHVLFLLLILGVLHKREMWSYFMSADWLHRVLHTVCHVTWSLLVFLSQIGQTHSCKILFLAPGNWHKVGLTFSQMVDVVHTRSGCWGGEQQPHQGHLQRFHSVDSDTEETGWYVRRFEIHLFALLSVCLLLRGRPC